MKNNIMRKAHVIKNVCNLSKDCIIINDKFKLFAFGNNKFGQLGLGDFKDRNLPTELKGLPLIMSISIAGTYTLLLDDQGFVWFSGKILFEDPHKYSKKT